MKKAIFLMIVIAGAISAFPQSGQLRTTLTKKDVNNILVYTCTMDPEIISDKPGDCPKCGMTLVKKYISKVYQCTMHPEVISDKPGSCSKCGMELKQKKLIAVQKDSMHVKMN